MRRWVAINKCLESLSESDKFIFLSLFEGGNLADIAKRKGITKELVRAKYRRSFECMVDMLFDPSEESL